MLAVLFFQAEDGIRDYKVTGVQTCALPIYRSIAFPIVSTTGAGAGGATLTSCTLGSGGAGVASAAATAGAATATGATDGLRSEERRVGRGSRAGGGAETGAKKSVTEGRCTA